MDKKVKACIYVFIGTLVLAAVVVLAISLANKTKIEIDSNSDSFVQSPIFLKAIKKCDRWFSMSVLWLVVEYVGVILPFEMSAAILYIELSETEAKKIAVIVISILSMALIILVYAVRPHDHMLGYRNAYVDLDHAINLYKKEEEKRNEDELITAMYKGELLISKGYAADFSLDKSS